MDTGLGCSSSGSSGRNACETVGQDSAIEELSSSEINLIASHASSASNSWSESASSYAGTIATASNASGPSSPSNSAWPRSQEEHTRTKYSHFRSTDKPMDPLIVMGEVLNKLLKNDVKGPQLFRLDSEFGLELGKGTQFKVTGPSIEYRAKLERAWNTRPGASLTSTLESLASSVVKRARWIPEFTPRHPSAELHAQNLSHKELTGELHSQLRSAEREIERLCNNAYKKHANIVRLKGWGLCLDTFEATITLNTRIPLLILERATCDLGDFLASSNYNHASYGTLVKICRDIGTGLGGLHYGNVTHGDMKPENVLLFAELSPNPRKIIWTAKLCDFGNAVAELRHNPKDNGPRKDIENNHSENSEYSEYYGTPGWTPPEDLFGLDFDGLKRCDIFVYGLIVWRVFADRETRGGFNTRTNRRERRGGPINIEKRSEYIEKDRAYRGAAMSIKEALNTGRIPSSEEMRRILSVVRAALEPVPGRRDTRPWKYFDTTRYPVIRALDENPGQEPDGARFFRLERPRFFPSNEELLRGVSESRRRLSAMNDSLLHKANGWVRRCLLNLARKSARQKAFESLFALMSPKIGLGWDLDNIATLEHAGFSCHDLSSFKNDILHCCEETGFNFSPSDELLLNSYARLRSRFKLCCWQHNAVQHQDSSSSNALHLLLCKEGDVEHWQRKLASSKYFLSTIAWLSRGEIGKNELRMIADGKDSSTCLWSWTYADQIPLEVRRLLFQLFVEKGCYVGVQIDSSRQINDQRRRDTAFSRYLESLVENSMNINTNYEIITHACTIVTQHSQLYLPLDLMDDTDQQAALKTQRQFFFTGESPDRPNDELSMTRIATLEDAKTTTMLHEAVLSCCYRAVKYFLDYSGIPPTIRDHNGETALDLALTMKASNLKPWQLVHINTIIGLLTLKSKSKAPATHLPLGWEEIELEPGFFAYRESTINPDNPSLTFEPPKFSLLQEQRISLGSRKSALRGLTYDFDLVRFMQKPGVNESKPAALMFEEKWYKADVRNDIRLDEPTPDDLSGHSISENTPLISGFPLKPHRDMFGDFFSNKRVGPWTDDDRIWIRVPARLVLILKVVFLRSYINLLLIFLPFSIIYQATYKSNPLVLLSFAFLSVLPLLDMWEAALSDIRVRSNSADKSQTIISSIGNCVGELCIGISAVFCGEVEFIQRLVIGSILCNQLFLPGLCFVAGGIHNTRTGWAFGIEQEFNITAQGLMSELTTLGSVISAILYLFALTQSSQSPAIEAGVLFLSRAFSIILLFIFAIWLFFRYGSHGNLFDNDFRDGYESDEDQQDVPLLSPRINTIIAVICLGILSTQTHSIVLSLHHVPQEARSSMGMYWIPIFLRIGKHFKSLRLGYQDKIDDSLDLTRGFAVVLCLFLGPLLVSLSWFLGQALTLRFDLFGTVNYSLSAWIMSYIVMDGKSNWLEGIALIFLYILSVVAFCLFNP